MIKSVIRLIKAEMKMVPEKMNYARLRLTSWQRKVFGVNAQDEEQVKASKKLVVFNASAEEVAAFDEIARAMGLTRSELLRRCAKDKIKTEGLFE